MKSPIENYVILLRPKHWIKNLLLFAAPFFGGRLLEAGVLAVALPAFIAFSLCASAVYIFNDIKDIGSDRLHPDKMKRPLASNAVSIKSAFIAACLLATCSFALSAMIAPSFLLFVLLYSLVQIAYSMHLKRIALLDIFCIASGFTIRVLAGGAAFHVKASPWLLVTMFMISLVLATGKRLGEITLLHERALECRKSLNDVSASVLTEVLLISAAASLISYALYTIEQSQRLIYTVPVVTFGIFRYIAVSKQGMGDPTEALSKDGQLALTVVVWLVSVGLLRY